MIKFNKQGSFFFLVLHMILLFSLIIVWISRFPVGLIMKDINLLLVLSRIFYVVENAIKITF